MLSISKQAKLNPYIPRASINYELMTDDEIYSGVDGTLIVDTETYPNYFLIAMKDVKTKKIIKFELSDTGNDFNVAKLSWILHSYTTIGFNYIKYDLPLIWLAFKYQDIEKIKMASDAIIFSGTWPKQLEKDYDFKIWPTKVIDLIEVCPLKGSLKLYGARLHAKRIQDLPSEWLNKPLEDWQIPVVCNYCINDLDLTELNYDNLTEQLQLRTNLSIEYKQDVMSKSDAQIAETVISSELKRVTGTWPRKPEIDNKPIKFQVPSNMFFQTDKLKRVLEHIQKIDFNINEYGRLTKIDLDPIMIGNSIYRMGIGGLHSSEENIAVKSNDVLKLYDRDVASFYPAIVLNCELFPKHLGESFLRVYQSIVNRRLEAKKAKRIAESENLKVTINGTFGKTGSPYSVLYAPEMTIQITVGGQLYLLMLIEYLELNNISVVSANTDGILIYTSYRQKMLDIIKQWELLTGFITEETEYEAIYSRDVNAYLAIGKDGKTKGKNIYYDPWSSNNPKDLYWRFQKNPTCQICTEAATNLITKQIPIEKTIRECKDITKFVAVKNVASPGAHKNGHYLGKVIRWVYSNKIVGTINYIATGNKVADTEGAWPLMDLEWVDHLNYDYYIARTVGMLYDMAYYQKPKQEKLI